ncbi:MAG: cell division protein FtsQ/DivIB [Halothermotrichaceae bacterium]
MSQNKLLAMLVAFISLIALVSFALSPVFQVHSFEFTGLNILEEQTLLKKIETYKKSNFFTLQSSQIKNKLMEFNYIEDLTVNKDFPDRLVIHIMERKPVAKIINNGKYLVISSEGYIIEEGSRNSIKNVPLIKGMGYSFNNNFIEFTPVFAEIVQALAEIDLDTISKLRLIEFEEGSVTAETNKFNIKLESTDKIKLKFQILESIFTKMEKEKLDFDYIDLSIPEKPVIKLKK